MFTVISVAYNSKKHRSSSQGERDASRNVEYIEYILLCSLLASIDILQSFDAICYDVLCSIRNLATEFIEG